MLWLDAYGAAACCRGTGEAALVTMVLADRGAAAGCAVDVDGAPGLRRALSTRSSGDGPLNASLPPRVLLAGAAAAK